MIFSWWYRGFSVHQQRIDYGPSVRDIFACVSCLSIDFICRGRRHDRTVGGYGVKAVIVINLRVFCHLGRDKRDNKNRRDLRENYRHRFARFRNMTLRKFGAWGISLKRTEKFFLDTPIPQPLHQTRPRAFYIDLSLCIRVLLGIYVSPT